jgi:pimeloyl-ACP methyl ester carboxylesterase
VASTTGAHLWQCRIAVTLIASQVVPSYASFAMTQALPNARLLIYPDSGHGFLFQYPQDFADEVLRFLR